ncbi:hypothetical protein FR483_n503L [Paramecium bursaria Chlorella virus FR483]|uniref:Uncharacterized protein n503L n=1 Tax=Paramecium bursaria Chlorella virus FR483 TaxID=399781 RepID=A7J7K7_PBCVF|nr:hypothetical protein FR483_n503L [Paramecium bursaria Chlorella virus FR483]ABT15788.1 hypothetical protein FR483_n503L [Paramecium bursaria Chlorella virus FR483]
MVPGTKNTSFHERKLFEHRTAEPKGKPWVEGNAISSGALLVSWLFGIICPITVWLWPPLPPLRMAVTE